MEAKKPYLFVFIVYIANLLGSIYYYIFGRNFYSFNVGYILNSLTAEEKEYVMNDNVILENLNRISVDLAAVKKPLSFSGEYFMTRGFIEQIKNRVAFENYLKQNPDILNVKIKDPVFFITLPRTGSTFLHCLLKEDPSWFAPRIWMQKSHFPSPSNPYSEKDMEIINKNRDEVIYFQSLTDWNVLSKAHLVSERDPEDLLIQLEPLGINAAASWLFGMEDYNKFIATLPLEKWSEVMKKLKVMFQCLMKNYPSTRLLSMSHIFCVNVESIYETFPDAKFVIIHRDPVKSVSSLSSLVRSLRKLWYNGETEKESYSYFTRINGEISYQMDKYLKFRTKMEEMGKSDLFVDVSFKNLVKDPIACVQDLYGKLGKKWTKEAEEKLKYFIENQTEHKTASHKYKITEDMQNYTKDLFKSYCERFKEFL
ncbi:unnamed protein product [Dimorphilus gyrociliatus]|uniref:Uncharacterized protein n=1 Tax=Dimorphilus gyrociliatus TaxID=2664684 RepID=A0A7I8V7L0_9ANNE|nr:unnamed protein product [Dimorphilus gyrociliatus]